MSSTPPQLYPPLLYSLLFSYYIISLINWFVHFRAWKRDWNWICFAFSSLPWPLLWTLSHTFIRLPKPLLTNRNREVHNYNVYCVIVICMINDENTICFRCLVFISSIVLVWQVQATIPFHSRITTRLPFEFNAY